MSDSGYSPTLRPPMSPHHSPTVSIASHWMSRIEHLEKELQETQTMLFRERAEHARERMAWEAAVLERDVRERRGVEEMTEAHQHTLRELMEAKQALVELGQKQMELEQFVVFANERDHEARLALERFAAQRASDEFVVRAMDEEAQRCRQENIVMVEEKMRLMRALQEMGGVLIQ